MERQLGINKDYAIFLAEEIIRQFHEYPFATDERMKLDKNKLANILMKAEGFDHKKRMQFNIPKDEENNRFNDMGSHLMGFFYPRRIITNYNTDYTPTRMEKTEQTTEESLWKARKVAFASKVICREMRKNPEISKIRQTSLARDYKYGLMAHFNTLLPNLEGPPFYGGETEIHIPLIFIPGSTKEDLDTLAKFCIENQNPLDRDIKNYTRHGIFKNYLYPNERAKKKSN